jgi:acetyl-CoA C-acetyltransferase
MKAVLLAKQLIQLQEGQVVIAGGTESMSQAPLLKKGEDVIPSIIHDGLTDAFSKDHMGKTAEHVASEYKITREMQDIYAQTSQERAQKAQLEGKFKSEILELEIDGELFAIDENIRFNSSLDKLASLKTAFDKEGTITAGNASPINDGAAALLLSSQEYALENDLDMLAVIKDSVEIGVEPRLMSISPIKAITELLKKTNLTIDEIDLFEINESFAVSSIIINQELNIPTEKVNVNGGAIAIGHAIGSTGARLLTSLAYQLKNENKRYGIASLCIGGGLGLAVLLENPNLKKKA